MARLSGPSGWILAASIALASCNQPTQTEPSRTNAVATTSASASSAPATPSASATAGKIDPKTLLAVVDNLEALAAHLDKSIGNCASAVAGLPAFHERSEKLTAGRETEIYAAIASNPKLNERFGQALKTIGARAKDCRSDPKFVELHEKMLGVRPRPNDNDDHD